LKQKQSVKRFT